MRFLLLLLLAGCIGSQITPTPEYLDKECRKDCGPSENYIRHGYDQQTGRAFCECKSPFFFRQ